MSKDLLSKINTFEKLAVYGSRKAFLAKIAQDAGVSVDPTPATQTPGPWREGYTASNSQTADLTPAGPPSDLAGKYPSIPAVVQDQLSALADTFSMPELKVNADGILGPSTRKALDAFKSYLKFSPTMTDSALFAKIKTAYDLFEAAKLSGLPGKVEEMKKQIENWSHAAPAVNAKDVLSNSPSV